MFVGCIVGEAMQKMNDNDVRIHCSESVPTIKTF